MDQVDQTLSNVSKSNFLGNFRAQPLENVIRKSDFG